MDFLLDVVAQGLAYGILAIGVLLTYQVLDYADLTVEGSFPLGAAVGAIFITQGWNPFVVLIAAFIAGVLAGYATGILHVKFRISSLLSGIPVSYTHLDVYKRQIYHTLLSRLCAKKRLSRTKCLHHTGTVEWLSLIHIYHHQAGILSLHVYLLRCHRVGYDLHIHVPDLVRYHEFVMI